MIFQISSKYQPIQSINIFKVNNILDRIFTSIIQDVNKLDWNITDKQL